MLRIFRAFAWLRWRVLMNSFERTAARDTLERFAIATDKLGPILALALLLPSGTVLAVLGLVAGYAAATGTWVIPLMLVRYLLLVVTALTLVAPLVLPTRDRGNIVRYLLLPIPRGVLYVAHVSGALADPWILLMVPLAGMIPVGLIAGGRAAAAGIALLGGLALLAFVTGTTTLVSSGIHLVLRNKRRGDLVMLIVVLMLSFLAVLPSALQTPRSARRPGGVNPPRRERTAVPPWLRDAAYRAARYVPSELYYRAVRTSLTAPAAAAAPLGWLAGAAVLVQALGFAAFRRTLDMPVSFSVRRAGTFGGLWGRTIPGLSPGASAVALTQLRLALRTLRGRSLLAMPLLFFAVFAVLIYRSGQMPFARFTSDNGLNLATFGCFLSIMSIMPLAMNQFAIDKAGFTRQMLSPLSISDLLTGKMVGNALVVAGPVIGCFILSALLFPGGHPALWGALMLSVVATFFLIGPAAAALSAVFPKVADLNSIGRASNPHQAAALLGLLSFAAAAAPSMLLVMLALSVFHRPEFAAAFLLVWCGVAYVLSRVLFIPVRRLVASRCEALSQYYGARPNAD